MKRPWFAIVWFSVWAWLQAVAVFSILNGTWERPAAFPEGYEALIYPDMVFIPLYVLAAVLLFRRHRLGAPVAYVAGGGVIYVMVYLFALAGFSGAFNLTVDGIFLVCTLGALWHVRSVTAHV